MLNPNKTQWIIFCSKICEKLKKSFPLNILGNFLSFAEAIRNLDIQFDSDFFPFLGISRISVSPVFWDRQCLRDSLSCHVALLGANALVWEST